MRIMDKYRQLAQLKDAVPQVVDIVRVTMDKFGNQRGVIQGTTHRVVLKKGDASRVWREAA